MKNFQKNVGEYSPAYSLFLEGTYGDQMLSAGGTSAIDRMFAGMQLQHKKGLDIGFGLGGAAFYLAEHYQMQVTGIEINPWMVEEATRRTPPHLRFRVKFMQYQQPLLPFPDQSFDIVYSKGVLMHVGNKLPLFKEVYRVLKPSGCLVIDDWLSPIKGQWGKRLQKMWEMENLAPYAQTTEDYYQVLKDAGFSGIQMGDENPHYLEYNQDVINRLRTPDVAQTFRARFGEASWQQAIKAYQLIIDSIQENELLMRWFKAVKR